MDICVKNTAVRFCGRWQINENNAVTTAAGSSFELAFAGTYVVLKFSVDWNEHPYPHLYIKVDNGAKIEVPLDRIIRIETEDNSNHILKVIFKGAMEMQNRWYASPLVSCVNFLGAVSEGTGVLPSDNRKTIEFIGDSITEGVLVDPFYQFEKKDAKNRPNQDDATATYAYLTAEKLNMRPVIIGYGGMGITCGGCGCVPEAEKIYPYNFENSPRKDEQAEIIVINYGANDIRWDSNAEFFIRKYVDFLKLVRKINPKSKIVVLSPFCGLFSEELKEMVQKFNKENSDNIFYINSKGWVPAKPLHPLREGHNILSLHLTKELKKIIDC